MPKRKGKRAEEGTRNTRQQGSEAAEREEEDVGNWKETLFFWRGELSLEQKTRGQKLVWHGSWVGAQDGEMPLDEDFASSKNKFTLHLPGQKGLSNPLQLHQLCDIEGKWSGSYLLEGRRTKDHLHRFRIEAQAAVCDAVQEEELPLTAVAAACGDTPFGQFVSLGRMTQLPGADGGRPSLRLDLARRYVDEDDPRAAWAEPSEVVQGALGGAGDPQLCQAPWQSLPLKGQTM
mmetsp:Transcript_137/g.502  ORF Transcript_137/g.502 Transcript_137/m.502 type:complete len:233 (-) Transcript_137:427-1125(-)